MALASTQTAGNMLDTGLMACRTDKAKRFCHQKAPTRTVVSGRTENVMDTASGVDLRLVVVSKMSWRQSLGNSEMEFRLVLAL